MSNMVIKPHSSFSEEGLDYVLTYYDDPQATIPSAAMSWMASTGLPKFTEDLRSATLDFVKSKGMPVVEAMFRRPRCPEYHLQENHQSPLQVAIQHQRMWML